MAKSLAVLVTNDLTGDSRVLKMCSSATTLGYQVTAFASPAAHIPAYEADLPFRIVRRQSTASDKSVTQKIGRAHV